MGFPLLLGHSQLYDIYVRLNALKAISTAMALTALELFEYGIPQYVPYRRHIK